MSSFLFSDEGSEPDLTQKDVIIIGLSCAAILIILLVILIVIICRRQRRKNSKYITVYCIPIQLLALVNSIQENGTEKLKYLKGDVIFQGIEDSKNNIVQNMVNQFDKSLANT